MLNRVGSNSDKENSQFFYHRTSALPCLRSIVAESRREPNWLLDIVGDPLIPKQRKVAQGFPRRPAATHAVSRSAAALPSPSVLHHLALAPAHHLRRSNPHSACRQASRSLSAVSSLGGFPTPAPEPAAPSIMGPASENLHISGSSIPEGRSCLLRTYQRLESHIE